MFLGNLSAAYDIVLLKEKNIRAVLTVADCVLVYDDKEYVDNHLKIEIEDLED